MTSLLPHTTSNTTTYTCLSCQIQFPSMQLQRIHMKTEWHRYNLKRRVAQLVPVSNDTFQLKVASSKDHVKYDDFGFVIEESKPKPKKHILRQTILNRGRTLQVSNDEHSSRDISPAISDISTFSLGTLKSQGEFENDLDVHSLASNSLKADITDYNSDDTENLDSSDFEEQVTELNAPLDLTDCFYCGISLDTIDDNIQHLLLNHSLYIPNLNYLSDKEGLIRFLSDTVVIDKECIKCGYTSNKLMGIRQHIIAKGHVYIPYETKEMRSFIDKYYDFTIIMDEHEDSSDGEIDDESDLKDEYTVATIDSTGIELALPNGFKLGHRSMSKYYRQNLSSRRLSQGEMTIAAINKENEKLLHIQETAQFKKDSKQLNRIHTKVINKELSDKGLKYRNKHEHYKNQRFG
ncbi:hypothetical protein CANINC_003897 [Pichia inconspicua]|uniref:ZN622/Rei1/Reh1 zinc finger C2H2-type domain-containing protein n=1 Tax=Pichia inconspicua TaxID=52247 RepID=A0A4T0WXG9_9ASCO|nr:hypothetical protein CANINC_003897 [[Candida] inconspicua]